MENFIASEVSASGKGSTSEPLGSEKGRGLKKRGYRTPGIYLKG